MEKIRTSEEMSRDHVCSLGLFGGAIDMTMEEMRLLEELRHTDNWKVLRELLSNMNDAMTIALRDPSADIQQLRHYQGIAACAGRIADIVEQDVPEWYAAREEEAAADAEGSSEEA